MLRGAAALVILAFLAAWLMPSPPKSKVGEFYIGCHTHAGPLQQLGFLVWVLTMPVLFFQALRSRGVPWRWALAGVVGAGAMHWRLVDFYSLCFQYTSPALNALTAATVCLCLAHFWKALK
jgi:hypothetical protein